MTENVGLKTVVSMGSLPGCPTHILKDDNVQEWVVHEHAVAKRAWAALIDVLYDAPHPRNAEYCELIRNALDDIQASGWMPDRDGT